MDEIIYVYMNDVIHVYMDDVIIHRYNVELDENFLGEPHPQRIG